jgi:hypothetical protein
MLQKLGWKGPDEAKEGQGGGAKDHLRKDWDRIEAMAGNAPRPNNGGV